MIVKLSSFHDKNFQLYMDVQLEKLRSSSTLYLENRVNLGPDR